MLMGRASDGAITAEYGLGRLSTRALGPTLALAFEGAQLGSFLSAEPALAPYRLDESVDIVAAVMIGDLVIGLDVLDRTDLDRVLDEIDFRVGPAGMIDIAGQIAPGGAVDRPAVVDLEQIPGVHDFGVFGADLLAAIPDNERALLDRGAGEEAEPRLGSANPKMTRRRQSRRHDVRICVGMGDAR